ncbi:hypothetical protein AB0L14_30300 [Streptomyces sp. NPDC052727]|uniref:hypothetical protein n=1 Tax=Streptomyces sp. NPDC052727 TaxID=3154854 RepID=UPI00342D525F
MQPLHQGLGARRFGPAPGRQRAERGARGAGRPPCRHTVDAQRQRGVLQLPQGLRRRPGTPTAAATWTASADGTVTRYSSTRPAGGSSPVPGHGLPGVPSMCSDTPLLAAAPKAWRNTVIALQ